MSVQIDFTTQELNTALGYNFFDETGVYNNPLNLTGFGTPNVAISALLTATVDTTLSDGTVCNQVNVLVPGSFPNTDDNPFLITTSLLGYTGQIPDGATPITYRITYNGALTDPPVIITNTKTRTKYFTAQIKCCIDSLVLQAKACEDCANCKEKNEMTKDAVFWYRILCANVQVGNFNRADEILLCLQNICRNVDCVNCP